jgi:hypothetical protein
MGGCRNPGCGDKGWLHRTPNAQVEGGQSRLYCAATQYLSGFWQQNIAGDGGSNPFSRSKTQQWQDDVAMQNVKSRSTSSCRWRSARGYFSDLFAWVLDKLVNSPYNLASPGMTWR